MKQVLLSGKGEIEVMDVPFPAAMPGSVLVQNKCSVISSGTEGAAVTRRQGIAGVYEKAMASSDRMAQVWEMAKTQGFLKTYDMVREKLADQNAIGYSSAGVVLEGTAPTRFKPGTRVACMGAGFANHAEYVTVPNNLVCEIPDGVSDQEASFGALACIALQGIRRLELTPGEKVIVVGLGLIGQLTLRLLEAMGYEALGIDISDARLARAAEATSARLFNPNVVDLTGEVDAWTGGVGADGVVICAATESDEVVNSAFTQCRRRGRVVIVGSVGLGIKRAKMYAKELELRLSCSYGPGRYDPEYELEGCDYPVEFARWTENRNLEFFLSLLARGKLDIKDLVTQSFPVCDAPTAYRKVKTAGAETFGILLEYPQQNGATVDDSRSPSRQVMKHRELQKVPGRIRLGLIGVGGYAKSVHIPNIKKLPKDFEIHCIAARTSASASSVARKVGAAYSTTDYKSALSDGDIDAVLISTRHASHGEIAIQALEAGKHVFVEKPMAISLDDCREIARLSEERGLIVRVGFNRRFSPFAVKMREVVGKAGPRHLLMRVNIGQLDPNHWSSSASEGGRLMGEGVHFLDLANWFAGCVPVDLSAMAVGEPGIENPSHSISVKYEDGTVATLIYSATGDKGLGKEYFEAMGNARSVRWSDYREFSAYGAGPKLSPSKGDKGQLAQMREFANAIHGDHVMTQGADAKAGLMATLMAIKAYESAVENVSVTISSQKLKA